MSGIVQPGIAVSGSSTSVSAASQGFRTKDFTLIDKVWMGTAGHPFTTSGTGSVGNTADTANKIMSDQCITVTTNGAGANTKISGTLTTPLNLTGKYLVLWIRETAAGHLLTGYPRIYLGDANLTNVYYWKTATTGANAWATDGDWKRITLPFGAAFTVGVPNRASLAVLTIQIFDDNSGNTVTVSFNGIATATEPSTAYPQGLISLSFDDGYVSQYSIARPYMDHYGFRGTAYPIAEVLYNHGVFGATYMTLANAQEMQLYSGWEIGCHAYTAANHNATYTSIGSAAALTDMQNAKNWAVQQGFNAVDHFAYPGGNYDDSILAQTRQVFATGRSISRVGGAPDETILPADYARLRSQTCGNLNSLASIEAIVLAAIQNFEWLVLVFHNIVPSATTNLEWATSDFQALMDYIVANNGVVKPVSEVIKLGMFAP